MTNYEKGASAERECKRLLEMTEHVHEWESFHDYLAWCPGCGKAPKAKDVVRSLGPPEGTNTYAKYFRRMKDKTPEDFYYMVALIEGEGCFTHRPRIEIGMNDKEPVERMAVLWRTGIHAVKHQGKPTRYFSQVGGVSAIEGMRAMRPHLSKRRQDKIDSIIAAYEARQTCTPDAPQR